MFLSDDLEIEIIILLLEFLEISFLEIVVIEFLSENLELLDLSFNHLLSVLSGISLVIHCIGQDFFLFLELVNLISDFACLGFHSINLEFIILELSLDVELGIFQVTTSLLKARNIGSDLSVLLSLFLELNFELLELFSVKL